MLQLKKTTWLAALGAVLVLSITVYFVLDWRSTKKSLFVENDPAFSNYISAYTGGVISSATPIRIVLTSDVVDTISSPTLINKDVFLFSPSIQGETYWIAPNVLEFRPAKRLEQGQIYEAEFDLAAVIEVKEKDLGDFKFAFKAMPQSLEVESDGLRYYDKKNLERVKLIGTVYTADVADHAQLKEVVSASQHGKALKVTWTHDADQLTHHYIIEDVVRSATSNEVSIHWDGSTIGVDQDGDIKEEIPALGDFKLMHTKVINAPDQFVRLLFSDPLSETQDLQGLIGLDDTTDFKLLHVDNEIHIYPVHRAYGKKTLRISAGINNVLNASLSTDLVQTITFDEPKPEIELVGEGVILPSTDGLIFPFRAINLKSVHVRIIRIYENNVAQFLQVNNYGGDYQLKRVGRPIVNKSINLKSGGITNLHKWSLYTLDLSEYIKTEPGAIYQVQLSFSRSDAVCNCPDTPSQSPQFLDGLVSLNQDVDDSDFDDDEYYYDDYYYEGEYSEEYDWNKRDDPCNPAFYYSNNTRLTRNVFASDLGIIAKCGVNGEYTVAVTDLRTTDPIGDVSIELLNFQRQPVASGVTDAKGLVVISTKKKPFLLIAKHGDQRGYLKLDAASSLSLSNFDVSGEKVQKGIKGFIYGERGVWRPGDSLYLTFILNDINNPLPHAHPVVMELYNPQDQLYKRIVKNNPVGKFYSFKLKTSDDAPTGNWMAKILVGGAEFTKRIKIEAVKPNRLKINLDFGTDKLSSTKEIKGKLDVKWLHGGAVRNLKTYYEVLFTSAKTTFKSYPNYVFDDESKSLNVENQIVFNGQLNELGQAVMSPNFNLKETSPGVVNAHFKGKVFEESGDFSVDFVTIPYFPYTTFAGICVPEGDRSGVLETGATHDVKLISVNSDGRPVLRESLVVELYKLDWRWWWENSHEDLAYYVSSEYRSPVKREEVSLYNGKGTWKMNVSDSNWGRYFIRVIDPVSKHSTGKVVFVDWPSSYGREKRGGANWATMLSFNSNKEKYTVGEKIQLTIPSSAGGKALVSIENGSKILKTFWVNTTAKQTVCSFEATPDMTPNVYAHVTLIQPHKQTVNDMPIRMYGVIPLFIEDPDTRLDPKLSISEVIRPEQNVSFKVSESKGKDMTYTVAIVDEGLLDLTKFKTPEPWPVFYAREALGVKSWDLYDWVCGAFGGKIERLLAIGGDEALRNKGGVKASRFKPVVKYLGPFTLKKGSTNIHTYRMPNYIGSVRVMVVAGNDKAYGQVEKTCQVKQSLMVLGTLPRVLGPDEEVSLPVTVFATDQTVKNATVSISTNDLITINGANAQSVTFSKIGDKVLYFNLKVKRVIGTANVKITAKSGNVVTTHEIELDVRNASNRITDVKEFVIKPGQTMKVPFQTLGMKGTNRTVLEVSSIPPINLEKRLQYLITYPHGCVEQTVSSVFPQLFLDQLVELSKAQKGEIEMNVKAAIDRLHSFQTADGGFAYWPGESVVSEWGSNYAGHFLVEAQRKGYQVPPAMPNKWKSFQRKYASTYLVSGMSAQSQLMQAYRLYVLALAKDAEMGAMNRLREQNNIPAMARWELAAAYHLVGQTNVAKGLLASSSISVQPYQELSYTFGSGERDQAMILEVLTLLNDSQQALKVLKQLSEKLSNNMWMSTQTTAYSLMSISKYVSKFGSASSNVSITYSLQGGKPQQVISNNSITQSVLPAAMGSYTLSTTNAGKSVVFARVITQGIPLFDTSPQSENGLDMDVQYLDQKGKPVDVSKLTQNTDVTAQITVHNTGLRGEYKELALTQIFPSGWEIHNNRLNDEPGSSTSNATYVDIKDDRVLTYFNLKQGERKTFKVYLNATYSGLFFMPSVVCEAMYDNTIYARTIGKWVSVTKPQIR